MILCVILQNFREILIGEKNSFHWLIFWSHQYQERFANYFSEFVGLLHEMISKEPCINQEMIYIKKKGEMHYNINIEKCVRYANKEETSIKLVTYKLIMSIYGSESYNLLRQIDHPQYTTLTIINNTLDKSLYQDKYLELLWSRYCIKWYIGLWSKCWWARKFWVFKFIFKKNLEF